MNIVDTLSRKFVDFADLDKSKIDLWDIAGGLSKICRFAGQIPCHYSVAEHSIIVSEIILLLGYSKRTAKYGLIHDATEAYMGDIPSPVKLLCPDYINLENKLMVKIENVLMPENGLSKYEYDIVNSVDKQMAHLEIDHFRNGKKSPFIQCLNSNQAFTAFILQWGKLSS